MKKYLQLSSLAFTLLLTHNFAHAETDKKLKDTESTGDKITLDSMVISADHLDKPFQKTNLIKGNLGASGDGADLLKKSAGISVIRQGGAASDPLLRGLGGTRLKISL